LSQKELFVNETDRDRFSRTGQLILGDKSILLPNFGPRIKSRHELSSLANMSSLFPTDNVGFYTIRFSDQPQSIIPKIFTLMQTRIDAGYLQNQSMKTFVDENVLLIDPCPEYLFYEGCSDSLLKQLKHINKTQRKLRLVLDYLQKKKNNKERMRKKTNYNNWKKSAYRRFWNELYRNTEELSKLIGEVYDIELKYNADILLPFVPVIDNDGMLDITNRINRISNAIAKNESASYYLLKTSVLKNEALVNRMVDYIAREPSKLTVIKIKNINLWQSGTMVQREIYRGMMRSLSYITEDNPSKAFLLLECGNHSLPSAAVGFDMVSTSMTGLDLDAAYGHNVYGGWYSPTKLWQLSYDEAKRVFRNNDGTPPCSCPACVEIGAKGIDNLIPSVWNNLRREHYIHTMNQTMQNISIAVTQGESELIRQSLIQSEVPKLAELILRM